MVVAVLAATDVEASGAAATEADGEELCVAIGKQHEQFTLAPRKPPRQYAAAAKVEWTAEDRW